MITEFQGNFRFLSNFYPAVIDLGIRYPTAEHAYQAMKTSDWQERVNVASLKTPGQAKRAGRRLNMRPNWDSLKLGMMTDIVRHKFYSHPSLANMLIATGDAELQEGNKWNDRYWGICRGVGKNHLGNILMNIRRELAA
jgi:ribA/ribD-fused uncharacterized protein